MTDRFQRSPYASPLSGDAGKKRAAQAKPFKPYLLAHRRLVLGVASLFFSMVAAYVLWGYLPQYTSQATVMIKDSALRAKYVSSEAYETTSSFASNPVLNTMSLLYTEPVAEALYDFFRLRHPQELQRLKVASKADWEELFEKGESYIKARNKPGTDVIYVKFNWQKDPEITREATLALMEAFQRASLQLNRQEQLSRYTYLLGQEAAVKENLEQVRHQLSEFQAKTKTLNIDHEILEQTSARADLQRALSQTLADAAGKRSQLHRLQTSLGLSPEQALRAAAIGGNSVLTKLYDKFYDLSQEVAQVSSLYTEKSPRAKELMAQLEQVQQDIQVELSRTQGRQMPEGLWRTFSDEAHLKTVAEMVLTQSYAAELSRKAGALQEQIRQLDARLGQIPAQQEEVLKLRQEEAALSESLREVQQKLLEAKMKESQTLSNVFIVDPPNLPYRPNFPNAKHLLVLGLLMGVALGVATTYVKWRWFTGGRGLPPETPPLPVHPWSYERIRAGALDARSGDES